MFLSTRDPWSGSTIANQRSWARTLWERVFLHRMTLSRLSLNLTSRRLWATIRLPPNTFLGLLLFLWLVAPGFLFTLLVARRRAAAKQSTFQETGRVILASIALSSVSAAISALVLSLLRVHVDLGRLIGDGRPYLAQHYRGLGAFLGLQLVIACALAVLVDRIEVGLIQRATGGAPPRLLEESAWNRPLGRYPAGSQPLVWLRLKNGLEFRGILAAFGHEIDLAHRELVLRDPIEIRYPGQQLRKIEDQLLVVQGADIEFLAVRYIPKAEPNQSNRK